MNSCDVYQINFANRRKKDVKSGGPPVNGDEIVQMCCEDVGDVVAGDQMKEEREETGKTNCKITFDFILFMIALCFFLFLF